MRHQPLPQGEQAFVKAMNESGVQYLGAIKSDGRIHRFETGKRGKKNGWYVFFGSAGAFGDWSRDIHERWSIDKVTLSCEKREDLEKQIAKSIESADAERVRREKEVAGYALKKWINASELGSSPYLDKKKINPFGVRFDRGSLVIPLKDVQEKLWSLQYIQPNGDKRFLRGGRKKGCFQSQASHHGGKERVVGKILSKEFGFLSAEQKEAAQAACQESGLNLVIGRAGTGKSTCMEAVARAYQARGYRVFGGAWSGAAAEDLGQTLKVPSYNLMSWFQKWERFESKAYSPQSAGGFFRSGHFLEAYKQQLTSKSVFILDEAGTVDVQHMSKLLTKAHAAGAKVIALGDYDQSSPIGPGHAFRALCEIYTPSQLDSIRRQKEPWMKEASHKLSQHHIADGVEVYEQQNCIQWIGQREIYKAVVQDYVVSYEAGEKEQMAIALRHEDVLQLNLNLHRKLKDAGHLGKKSLLVRTQNNQGNFTTEFTVKDRILFHRNDTRGESVKIRWGKGKGVTNGTLGTVNHIHKNALDIKLDDGRTVRVDPKVYPYLSHGYAMTISKAQGKTFEKVYPLINAPMDAATTYVALTRHRDICNIYVNKKKFPTLHRLIPQISREAPFEFIHRERLSPGSDQVLLLLKSFEKLRQESAALHKSAKESEKTTGILFYHQDSFVKAQGMKPQLKEMATELLQQWEVVKTHASEAPLDRYSLEVIAGERKKLLGRHEREEIKEKNPQQILTPNVSSSSQERDFYDKNVTLQKIPFEDVQTLMETYTPFTYNPRKSTAHTVVFSTSGKGTSIQVNMKNGLPVAHNFKEGYGADLIGFLAHYSTQSYGEICRGLGKRYSLETQQTFNQETRPKPSVLQPPSKESVKREIARRHSEKQDDISKIHHHIKALHPIEGTLGETYLKLRGITKNLPADLKFHSSQHGPSLVALARDHNGNVTAFQRIRLDPETAYKAKGDLSKISRGCVYGSSILLQKDTEKTNTTFLAEGIETALSLREAGIKGDIRATLGKGNLLNVALTLDASQRIILVADNDGQYWRNDEGIVKTLDTLHKNGCRAGVNFPEDIGSKEKGDFNDTLTTKKGIQKIQEAVRKVSPNLIASSSPLEIYQQRARLQETLAFLKNGKGTFLETDRVNAFKFQLKEELTKTALEIWKNPILLEEANQQGYTHQIKQQLELENRNQLERGIERQDVFSCL